MLSRSVLVAALLFAACGGDGTTDAEPADAPDKATEVIVDLVAFMPEQLTVEAGATVTWTQNDTGDHTITSGTVEPGSASVTKQPDGRFDSGPIASGSAFEFTFDAPGTYPYFCALHPATMRGEIRVT